jgi:hypothetical protein
VSPEVILTERPDLQVSMPGGTANRSMQRRPWRPPMPLQPSQLDVMFRPGARYTLPGGDAVVVEIAQVGRLRMPSGRLIVADPAWLDTKLEPFTTAIRPGAYRVTLAVIRFEKQPTHQRVAAAKLVVRNEPVASWELALRPGEDPMMLGDQELFGFAVDAGMACFLDAAVTTAMVRVVTDAWEAFIEDHEVVGSQTAEVSDPESGANLIAFHSGWGDGYYPTWIGRTAEGEAACFVADMLVLHDATILN